MFKKRSLVICSVLVLVLAIVAMSCAPAPKPTPTPTPPPATAPAPAATPPAEKPKVPEIPSVPPIPKQLQGEEAVRYVDTANGFSIWYPKSWPDYGPGVVAKARKAEPGYDAFTVVVESKQGNDLLAQLKSDYMNNPAMKNYGVEVKPISSGQIKLADGTVATEAISNAVLAGGVYTVWLYAIAIDKGDKYIIATGSSLRGESAQQGVKEIVQTFSLDTK